LISACSNQVKHLQGYVDGDFTYISSAKSGTIEQLFVNRGDIVNKSTILYKLDPEPEQSIVLSAIAKLKQAKKTLKDMEQGRRKEYINSIKAKRAQVFAKLIYDKKMILRYKKLYQTGAIDQAAVDMQRSKYITDRRKIEEIDSDLKFAKLGSREDQIEAQKELVKSIGANLKQAEWQLNQKFGVSKSKGIVFDVFFRSGEFVPAGRPIVSILYPENVHIVFYIPEKNLSKIKLGQIVSFKFDGSNKIFSAKISYISEKAEYTPPVIYSKESRSKLVFKIYAKPTIETAKILHVGQPIDILL